uniref:MAM domain-containing protein n=1 Tax=Trichuris muris TaxID=70415 RepID=A0A5S6QTG4_TRIMR
MMITDIVSTRFILLILFTGVVVLSSSVENFCEHINCDFQHGSLCHYANSRAIGPEITKPWIIRQIRMHSAGTDKRHYCNSFAAAYLDSKDTALMETVKRMASPATIRFKYYEATNGVQLLVCCGDPRPEACSFKSNLGVTPEDHNWQTGMAKCPAGTDKIVFVAINSGEEEGVVSVDDIECA